MGPTVIAPNPAPKGHVLLGGRFLSFVSTPPQCTSNPNTTHNHLPIDAHDPVSNSSQRLGWSYLVCIAFLVNSRVLSKIVR